MPISFACPHCGHKSQADDAYAGQSGPCAKCGATITIPGSAAGSGATAAVVGGSVAATIMVVLGVAAVVLLACGGVLAALLLPAVQSAREAARRVECTNNMKMITLALLNYETTKGVMPPAYLADENGKPMHSWRVLILPYIEEQQLYDQYNFEEPWNSPGNLALAKRCPRVFQCPSDPSDSGETHYQVLTGSGTLFEGDKSITLRNVGDGLSQTIFVAEAENPVNWLEPRDIDASRLGGINSGQGIGSAHPQGAIVSFGDGSVRFLQNDVDRKTLRALSTANGQEVIQRDY